MATELDPETSAALGKLNPYSASLLERDITSAMRLDPNGRAAFLAVLADTAQSFIVAALIRDAKALSKTRIYYATDAERVKWESAVSGNLRLLHQLFPRLTLCDLGQSARPIIDVIAQAKPIRQLKQVDKD